MAEGAKQLEFLQGDSQARERTLAEKKKTLVIRSPNPGKMPAHTAKVDKKTGTSTVDGRSMVNCHEVWCSKRDDQKTSSTMPQKGHPAKEAPGLGSHATTGYERPWLGKKQRRKQSNPPRGEHHSPQLVLWVREKRGNANGKILGENGVAC